jgi:hypothetical protein
LSFCVLSVSGVLGLVAVPVFAAGAFWEPAAGAGAAFAAGDGCAFGAGVCCARTFPGSIIPATKKSKMVMVSFLMKAFSHGSAGFANRAGPRKTRGTADVSLLWGREAYNPVQG